MPDMQLKPGKVFLVGAGPGDYRLITLKAVDAIKQADTIVYDRLADDRLLQYARPDVELIYVGKASSDHTMRQEDINRLLVDKAQAGKTVVRLKGGDPFVFGRGGEEALGLVANHLEFEIVPGVTSAIAVPAYAGIPVTHRGLAVSFAVITGHEDPAKPESSVRWDKLATGVDTLIFLMGVENLPHITAKLLEHGRPADTPAAIIRWGTKPEQEVWHTTLGQAAQDVIRHGIKPPAIFLVGEVAGLREQLAWFDRKLLFGKRILVTRTREQASLLTARLENLGAMCLEAPAIRIEPPESYNPVDMAIQNLRDYHWVVLTSVNGVKAFFARLEKAGKDARALGEAKVAAIGAQTAACLREYGIIADIVPVEFRAEGVAEALAAYIRPGDRVLIPRAAVARDLLPDKLTEMGAAVEVTPVYRTVAGLTDGLKLAADLADGKLDMVTFTSSSTVTNTVALLGPDAVKLLANTKIACIGPVTAGTCYDLGITPAIIASEYTIQGLVQSITEYFKQK
ncbi:uroporphyrinogen-III C-methyltransferase [Acetonema longum]|uniref:uroporphyrinogen-III C-methyltransferase n=1 Tax=Acetonema longum DSM 6540 TaxID=1009370 RepID=F7NJ63_9FIRM|nr:uroporphyrinogen-III C-methyltransferase [Acetonema longum]EGO63910.1 uroporphyrin-III C-methyltransferase [Acetonema longum DSM 6540]